MKRILLLSFVVFLEFLAYEGARAAATLTTLHVFNNNDGNAPMAGLLLASDGNFYGTTAFGGAYSNCIGGVARSSRLRRVVPSHCCIRSRITMAANRWAVWSRPATGTCMVRPLPAAGSGPVVWAASFGLRRPLSLRCCTHLLPATVLIHQRSRSSVRMVRCMAQPQ